MAAITRWTQYSPTSQGTIGKGRNAGCVGIGTAVAACARRY